MENKRKIKKQGFTIVEIIIVIVVVVSVFGTILSFFTLDIRNNERNRNKLQAVLFAKEAMEAVRNFRDNTDWSVNGIGTLTAGADYHPVIASSGWGIVSGVESSEIFTRTVVFNNISRDANDNIEIIYNPANTDTNTKSVTVTVNWADRYGETSESLKTYLTNWRN